MNDSLKVIVAFAIHSRDSPISFLSNLAFKFILFSVEHESVDR
jgi:hypothetical protein